jgi:hypothetical protein
MKVRRTHLYVHLITRSSVYVITCSYEEVYVYLYACVLYIGKKKMKVYTCAYIYVCMYLCKYVCVYTCTYI